jgi:hypothetical protein
LAEALIISSETKIPNNLLVDTENSDWRKLKDLLLFTYKELFFLSEYYCLLKKLSDKTTFPNDLLHSTHDVYEVLYKDSSTSLCLQLGG